MSNVFISLTKENGWEKIGECLDEKYFVNKCKDSDAYGSVIRKLTDEEFDKYDIGVVIEDLIGVGASGWRIYRNRRTKAEYRLLLIL